MASKQNGIIGHLTHPQTLPKLCAASAITKALAIASTTLFFGMLSACGTNEVVQKGSSVWSVSAQYGSVNGSFDRAQKEALEKGKAFCAAKGDEFIFMDEQRSGVPGYSMQVSTITFSCGPDIRTLQTAASSQCRDELKSPELDAIRGKVELERTNPDAAPPFQIAVNDTFPTNEERAVIAKWATIRDECAKKANAVPFIPPGSSPMRVTFLQQDKAFATSAQGRIGDLIVFLYQQKLTYGEFAKKRYEISRDAYQAQLQFRQSVQIADQQRQLQAQQIAEQQFQNNLAAFSNYMQIVNARQPLTVRLDGSVRLQSNCVTTGSGNSISTTCK
ncbi:hypothetical protein [Candidatus Skiveiella danica]|uniref:hypothetical protein n=1 Tax=Candidatus Skiveiella danica TaxID=3386177 RepID=UPI0039B8A042